MRNVIACIRTPKSEPEQIANFKSYLTNSFVTNQITGIAKLQTYFEKGHQQSIPKNGTPMSECRHSQNIKPLR